MNQFSAVSEEQLRQVEGGFNYSLWNNGTGVIFFPTGIAWVNADGKSGGFLPTNGSNGGQPTTWPK